MTKVWLLTGTSRGLGRAIAETVLAAGDYLVAGARDPRTLNDLAVRYRETLRTVPLDVNDPVAAEAAVQVTLDTWGPLGCSGEQRGLRTSGAIRANVR
jgi:NADP-dependent 3-hydroxy acid dehydrogenase YdfG